MHKCPNCGFGFDGNFCPECGVKWQEDKTCPKCGAKNPPSANFCANCGYLFTQAAEKSESQTTETPSQPQIRVYVKQQKPATPQITKIYEYLKYVPIILFALFSVLIFAFYAAPVATMPLFGSYGNVYELTGVSEISEIQGSMIFLIILAAIYFLAAAAAVYCFIKYRNKYIVIGRLPVGLMQLCGAISIVLYIITLIIGSVACGKIFAIAVVGAAPILIVAFSSVFMVLAAGALITRVILNRMFYDIVPVEESAAKEACKKVIASLPELPVKNAAFNALKYVPVTLFTLFSLLSITFLAASAAVLPSQEFFGIETPAESYGSVYALASGDTYFTELRPYMIALIVAMAISLCYSLIAVLVPKKEIKQINYFGYITVPLYVVWLVLACVVCGKISAYDEGMGIISAGTAPILIIVFSIIFALLAVGVYVAKYLLAKKDPALSSFESDLFGKNLQRKAEIRQRKLQLAEEYKAANPAPAAVAKPDKTNFKNTSYYKAKKAQNFKTSFYIVLLAFIAFVVIFIVVHCINIYIKYNYLVTSLVEDGEDPYFLGSYFDNLFDPGRLGHHLIYNTFFNIFDYLIKLGVSVLIPIFIISIMLIVLIHFRKLKSTNSACSKKGLNTIWICLLVITVAGLVLAAVLFVTDLFIDENFYFVIFIFGLIVLPIIFILCSIPYFIARNFINKARIAIYGSENIKYSNPIKTFEELCSERENYKESKAEYKNYRKAKAAYNAEIKKYISENLSSNAYDESNNSDQTYTENNIPCEKPTQVNND